MDTRRTELLAIRPTCCLWVFPPHPPFRMVSRLNTCKGRPGTKKRQHGVCCRHSVKRRSLGTVRMPETRLFVTISRRSRSLQRGLPDHLTMKNVFRNCDAI